MPAQCPLTSSLALLVLLGTARAGPFSPRSNVTLSARRPPPRPGGRTVEAGGGSPSSQHYEHTVEGGEKQVVFTHRINLPPSGGCGCPPGSEPPVPASEVQALRVRLEVLEELVKGLREQCTGGCCPAAAQAGTGQTDVRSLCSLHGVFDLSRCACSCEPGWGGPTCSDPTGTPASSPPPPPGSCPDDCNDQGRCVRGRCACFPGYAGPSCGWPSCPGDCQGRGRCVQGVCVCRAGFTGPDCGQRACPRGCSQRGRCEDGRCACDPGFSGEDCGERTCARDCGEGGRCVDGRCACWPGYAGDDCGTRTCPRDCRGRGRCEDGECICDAGYSGDDCGVRSCPGDCSQRGRCEDGRCVCWPGYTGRDCGTRACPGDCRGRGRCVDGRCVCDAGFAGEDCGSRRCPGDCRGRGRCEDGVCVCDAGHSGEDCGLRACPRDCHRHGRCEDGRCVCHPGYTGPACAARTCPADCRGRGRCVQGVCLCHAGYGGEDCGREEPPASACPGGCGPRELCRAGQCVCVEGFRGPDCAIQTCPGDCRGRGECRQGSCVCQDGYAGEDCGEEVPAIEGLRMHLLEETTVRTEWTRAPGPVDAYEIQFIPTVEGGSPPFTARVPSSASAYDQRGLAPGQEYQVTVRALRGPSWGPPASKTITTMIDGPQDLRVVAVTPTTLELSWLRPLAEVDRFVVSYVSAGNQRVRLEVPPEADGTLLTDLMPGVEYVVTVTAERGRAVSYPASVRANTGTSPLGATDEPPPAGPSTTQGAEARLVQRPQVLGELRVLGKDKTGRLHVAWNAQPDTFDRFRLHLQVPEGPGAHEELLPGEARQALVPPPPSGVPYMLLLHGILPGGEPSVPITYQGIMDEEEEEPRRSPGPPRLGELTVTTGVSSDSLLLLWTVAEGEFDSFVIQYKDKDGPHVLPVEGPQRSVLITSLEPGRKYKFVLYGLVGKKRHGPLVAEAKMLVWKEPSPETPPRLGNLWVTDPTPDSLHLSWTVPEGQFDSFMVQYRDRDGRPQVVPVEGPDRSVTVSPLDPDHKYKFSLFGIANKKRYGPLTADGTTAPERTEEPPRPESPEQPLLGELTVTGVTPDSLLLSWTVAQGPFDSFVVQYKDAQGQPRAVPVGGDQNELTVSGLESNRKYKMNLYGLRGRRRVGPASVVAKTAPQETPDATEPSTEALKTPEEPRLGELTMTGATPDSLTLSWTVSEGRFDHFLVQYRNGDGQPKALRVPGHEDEVTVSGLEPANKYKIHLYGFHSGQRVGPVSVVGVTAAEEETPSPTEPTTEAPEPPEEPLLGELTVTDASPDSLSLSWTVAQGHFDSFTIQYKDRDGRPQVVRVGGEERAATVSELDPGHKYKMNLYGFHQDGRVGPVSAVAVTAALPTQPPVEPRLGELAVAAVTSDTVRLSWTVVQGTFESFLVQYRDVQGQPQTVPVNGDLREVTISALSPARKYKFLLFGLQDGTRHGPVFVDAKTLPAVKPTPRLGELTVTDATPHSVGLSWTIPEGEFDSFMIQYKDKDGQPQMVPAAADQREVTVPSLEPNKRYKFLLYGLAGRKRLGPISAEGITAPLKETPQPPPRLGELATSGQTSDSLHLSWTVAQGSFDSFLVQYRDTDGQLKAVPVAADQREVTVQGLEPGRTYKFLLYGLVGGQRMGPISALGATAPKEGPPAPEDPEPPEAPRLGLLAVTEATPDSLRLSWSVARGPFDSFVVQYEDIDGQPQALLVDGNQNKVLISGLEPGTSYKFFLYGLHKGKRQGPISTEGTTGPPPAGQTPGDPGPRLSQLSVTDVTTSSLRLNWEAPLGAFDSFLLRFGVPMPSTLEPHPRPPLQRELMVPGTRRSAVLRDLHPGTLYSLTLYGLRGPHKADSIQGTARTLSPVLESPRDLQFSDIRETSARVSWVPPPSRVDSFKVSYQLADGGEPQSTQVDGRAQTHNLRGLIPGARYEVTVVSVRGFEESEPLTGFLTTIPDGPTQLRALNLTEGSALLHWMAPQNPVDKYNVRVSAPGAPPLQGSAPGSAVDYPLHDLVLHTNYTATVRGLRGPNLTSPASITFTTGLQGPQDLEAKEVTPRTALLTWIEPQVPPTGYLLSFNTPGGQTQEILLPARVTSHRLLGLFPSTPYSARLQAVWGVSLTPPLATSFTTGGLRIPFPRDCGEEMQNGASTSRTATIFLNGNRERPLNVFCDMETDGGGWLVFQRRMDGQTDFWRDWDDYAHGFGNISGEFWLGNEALHSLTQAGDYTLRVDLRAGDEAVFAQYDSFRVDSAAKYYRLHLEGFHGTAGDSMSYHSGSVFSARDRDPNNLLISCAVSYRGAWWYRNCHYANLNGLYGSTVDHQGVSWYHWKGFDFSVPFTEMKLRPRSYRPPARGG